MAASDKCCNFGKATSVEKGRHYHLTKLEESNTGGTFHIWFQQVNWHVLCTRCVVQNHKHFFHTIPPKCKQHLIEIVFILSLQNANNTWLRLCKSASSHSLVQDFQLGKLFLTGNSRNCNDYYYAYFASMTMKCTVCFIVFNMLFMLSITVWKVLLCHEEY